VQIALLQAAAQGTYPEEDDVLVDELLKDGKELAEHMM